MERSHVGLIKQHNTANRVALVHQVKGVIDFLKWQGVGDEIINIDRVCQIDCVKGKNSSWKAIAKLNGETVEGRFPIGNRHRPLLGNILNR
ncbi:MAG TPA: hypothetical protein IGS53_19530, partial [Leptolyngbyaceae cyanobacterium M33_DOE_097]|nr:hypothetical protein [Leptolyngbyaceae cyanobacterium M33_DOE_097]